MAQKHASKFTPVFRGNAAVFQQSTAHEVILSGASETGKTFSMLWRLHRLCADNKNVQAAIVRKTFADIAPSVLQTFTRKILTLDLGVIVETYGGGHPAWFDYANGSRIWLGGMDKPGKVLSSERDIIYVNQAEQLTLDDWETLTTRVTGRAGNLPFAQLVGDCNPAGAQHWILQRAATGALSLLPTYHRDNPFLFNDDGTPTAQGEVTLARLGALSGHRRKRLYEGLWASPEGLVYDNFSEENITDASPDPNAEIEISADDGYIDPRAILFIQRTATRILIFDEIYHSRHLAETCVQEVINKCGEWFGWKDEEKTIPKRLPELCVGSPEAKELQQRFRLANIPYRSQPHKIVDGIAVVRRLICDVNGVRILQVHRRCVNFLREIQEGYLYPTAGQRSNDEVPLDENNHEMDSIRYWCFMRARR